MPIRPQLQGKGTVSLSFAANLRYVRPIRHFVSALCALAMDRSIHPEWLSIGLPCTYVEPGSSVELARAYRLDAQGVLARIRARWPEL